MTDVITQILLMAGSAVLGGTIMNKVHEDKDWYDFFHVYFEFAEDYTELIDALLMKGVSADPIFSKVSIRRKIADNQDAPAKGVHCYFPFLNPDTYVHLPIAQANERVIKNSKEWSHELWYFVGFRKMETKQGDASRYYYRAYYLPSMPRLGSDGQKCFDEFQNVLLSKNIPAKERYVIRVVSINISDCQPKLNYLDKICDQAKSHQVSAMNLIMNHWNSFKTIPPNTKVIIFGDMGVGKTYTAMLLKKLIERDHINTNVRVVWNFDPNVVGVDIDALILRSATANSPIILVINEIDEVYEKTVDETQMDTDPRTRYTKNRTSFNNMMDSIAQNPFVILLMTTNQTPKQLYERKDWRSFFRIGRVDFFLEMTEKGTTRIENDPTIIQTMPY